MWLCSSFQEDHKAYMNLYCTESLALSEGSEILLQYWHGLEHVEALLEVNHHAKPGT